MPLSQETLQAMRNVGITNADELTDGSSQYLPMPVKPLIKKAMLSI